MKIVIIKGVYGHKENGSVVPKDKNSEPFEVADEQAMKLIKAGVAKKADGLKSEAEKPIRYSESLAEVNNVKTATAEAPAEETNEDEQNESEEGAEDETLQYSMENTQKELLAMAKQFGFEGSDSTPKQQLIDFLDEATAGDAPQIGDDLGVVG